MQGQAQNNTSNNNDQTLDMLASPAPVDASVFDWSKVSLPSQEGVAGKENGASADSQGNAEGQKAANTAPAVFDIRAFVKEKFGPNADLGDDLSAENAFDRLNKVFNPQAGEHPEVAALRDSIGKGLTPEQHWEQRTATDRLIKMSDKELMTVVYRSKYGKTDSRPSGMDEAAIARAVEQREAAGHLTIDAAEQRAYLESERAKRNDELSKSQQQAARPNWADPAVEQEFVAAATKAAAEIAKAGNGKLFGIGIADIADQNKIAAITKEWFFPDVQTGISKYQRSLQDNNAATEMAILFHLREKGLLSKLSLIAKDQAKMALIDKLELQPGRSGGASAMGGGGSSPDLDALAAPARLTE